MIANALQILAYFFNPSLRVKRDREKVWSIFNDLEEKLAKALVEKDMYLVDRIRFWLKEMRDKYDYLKEGK
jgi:hypothetical protein